MNVLSIPYHDWRKIEAEGSRTRDSHIISHLASSSRVDNLLIVNRPITYTELLLKKKKRKIKGEAIFKYKRGILYRVGTNKFVFDYISSDLLGPLIKQKKWFIESYDDVKFQSALTAAIEFLAFRIDIVFTQNVFSAKFAAEFNTKCVFDAWDNFILFPESQKIFTELRDAYMLFSTSNCKWITNSLKNIEYYKEHYNVFQCELVKNGVDVDVFKAIYDTPDDLKNVTRPIIGFGGKITHLFDYKLYNFIVQDNPDKSFVIVGQILDKSVFNNINKAANLFYLGDKTYSLYPSYVTNFDLGIIPYVTDHLEHGADSIKVYEYLAAGLPIIGTKAAGMGELGDFISLANNKEHFSHLIGEKDGSEKLTVNLPEFYTWKYKTDAILNIFDKIVIDG